MTKRQIKIGLIGVLLLFMTIGTTYAWWTATTQVKQTINMGNLLIEAKMEKLSDDTNYEPGLTINQDGTVSNNGSIEAIIRVDSGSEGQSTASVGNAKTRNQATNMIIRPTGGDGYWFKDPNGEAYLLLSPGETAKVDFETTLIGEHINNEYNSSTLDIIADLKATQVLEGAILAEFGIDFESLVDYDTATSHNRSSESGIKVLRDLVNRGN